MRRSFVLPSDLLDKSAHDCRPESIKFKNRDVTYDVSVLTTLMSQGKSSLNSFYESYLHRPEDLEEFQSGSSSQSIHTASKVIKETNVNSNHHSYGNLLWCHSITSHYNGDVILVDTMGHRVLLFNREFIFKYQLGCKGSENGEFDEPTDALLSENGKLYVSDKNNCRIQIFAESKKNRHNLSTQFSKQNNDPELKKPKAIIFKASSQYNYVNMIKLDDKPIKMSSSPFNSIIAVSTESGIMFIINEYNQVATYLKMKKNFDIGDLYNFCLNDMGSRLFWFRNYENMLYLKIYDTNLKEDANSSKEASSSVKKINLIESLDVEKNYMPGICLARIGIVKLTLDLKHFLIFDTLNVNLLEYDLNGNFLRIILKAEERLGNLLAFDFSGDRQHLITSEIHFNKRRINPGKSVASLEQLQRNASMTHLFKLRTYKFMTCECHRYMEKHESLHEIAKNNTMMTQSFNFLSNEPSIATFSKSNF